MLWFTLQSDSGGAFKGFKGLVAPSGGGGFSGFGAGAGAKPLEGLSNGTSMASASAFSSAAATPESKATFGKLDPLPPLTGPLRKLGRGACLVFLSPGSWDDRAKAEVTKEWRLGNCGFLQSRAQVFEPKRT